MAVSNSKVRQDRATYYVAVADYGGETFSHWGDGTADSFFRLVVGDSSAVVDLTAVYSP